MWGLGGASLHVAICKQSTGRWWLHSSIFKVYLLMCKCIQMKFKNTNKQKKCNILVRFWTSSPRLSGNLLKVWNMICPRDITSFGVMMVVECVYTHETIHGPPLMPHGRGYYNPGRHHFFWDWNVSLQDKADHWELLWTDLQWSLHLRGPMHNKHVVIVQGHGFSVFFNLSPVSVCVCVGYVTVVNVIWPNNNSSLCPSASVSRRKKEKISKAANGVMNLKSNRASWDHSTQNGRIHVQNNAVYQCKNTLNIRVWNTV